MEGETGVRHISKSACIAIDMRCPRNVHVTLHILKALIEKSPRDLPLYAPYILRILGLVLRAEDLTMVEDSIPTFHTFCEYHDVATLAADQEYIMAYEEIVKMYANFAGKNPSLKSKASLNAPTSIRWRSAGLEAIRSITSSEAVGADGGRQLNIILPVILQNVYSESQDHLMVLHERAHASEKSGADTALRRRMSTATVQTVDPNVELNPATISVTTADADRMAEEEVGLKALQSLKQIFVANSRGQIRMATVVMLRFISSKVPQLRPATGKSSMSHTSGLWATALMETVTKWAPVQDRFVILVTVMETLVRSPIAEENLEQQLVLVGLVGWLLRSSINMIGLSVMDVLLGLVQHILLLLQLGGKGSNVLPHHQQTDAIDLFQEAKDILDQPSSGENTEKTTADVSSPSTTRQELLIKLQRCIGDLATHIYYTDQISDMITAILLRLKPSPLSGISNVAAAIERPAAAAKAISNSVNLQENPQTDEFFSFGTARLTALKAIKEVLIVANMKGSSAGAAAIGRPRVSVQVWEGTQWLIRDEDRRVRRAYVDALLTWLKLEMSKDDLRVMEDKREISNRPLRTDGNGTSIGNLTKRAVSNASQRDKSTKPPKSTFLPLLHLAIYHNAIESPESDADILLLHLLMAELIEKLGVNAVKNGLPMIMRLQEDINVDETISTPTAKLKVGSLVHGYFWKVSEQFDFDASKAGYEISHEISRRKAHGLWLDTIQIPPLPLEQIVAPTTLSGNEKLPLPLLQKESLKPFDSRLAMVNGVATAYSRAIASPPSSPPTSPARVFSMPILSSEGTSLPTAKELPVRIKEAMLMEWTKDSYVANTIEKENSRSISLNGSRSGTNLSVRQTHLAVNGQAFVNGSEQLPSQSQTPPRRSHTFPIQNAQENRFRRSSAQDTGSPTPVSSSDQATTLRVDDLKRALAGGALTGVFGSQHGTRAASPLRNSIRQHKGRDNGSPSTGSESVVSAGGFDSTGEGDFSRQLPPAASKSLADQSSVDAGPPIPVQYRTLPTQSPSSVTSPRDPDSRQALRSAIRPSSSSSSATEDPAANAKALKGEHVASIPLVAGEEGDDEVPPVPPLPSGVAMHGNVGLGRQESIRNSEDDGGGGGGRDKKKKGVDVLALLGSIDAVAGEGGGGMGRPPY